MEDICMPKVIVRERVYEGPNEYSIESLYNCNICYTKECPYYKEYN